MNIRILHVDRPDRADDFRRAVNDRVARLTGGSEQAAWVDAAGPPPDAVVLFGSPGAAADPAVEQAARAAVEAKVLVLSFVDNLLEYPRTTPPALQHLNGVEWESAEAAAELVLRSLGISDADRRVFLSYRRKECSELALQLFDHLHRAGFSVFLDRFGIPAGADVWQSIEEALHDMAFVLLLESAEVAASPWVAEREIGYAMEYDLGLMALALPDISDPPPFPSLPPDKRERLREEDLAGDRTLTDAALKRILPEISGRHEKHLRERRERMLADVAASLEGSPVRYGPTSLLSRRQGEPEAAWTETLVRICPRPADYRDVFALGRDCERRPPGAEAWIVSYPGGNPRAREIAGWFGDLRNPKVAFLSPLEVPGRVEQSRAAQPPR